MEQEKLDKITKSINKKLGKENAGIIADDLGMLITENEKTIKDMKTKDNKIKDLEDRNEKLISSNGNLLQQISMEDKHDFNKEQKEEKKEKFSFKSAFNDKGEFI